MASYEEKMTLLERDLDSASASPSSWGKNSGHLARGRKQSQSLKKNTPPPHRQNSQSNKSKVQNNQNRKTSQGSQKGQKQKQPQQRKQKNSPNDSGKGNRQRGGNQKGGTAKKPATLAQFDDPHRRKKASKAQVVQLKLVNKQVTLFSHLPQYERPESVSLSVKPQGTEHIHPAIVNLGIKYADHVIVGSDARCIAMLDAFAQVIQDYHAPTDKSISIDLDLKLRPLIQFLKDCRPLSIGMGNAIKFLKRKIGRLGTKPEAEAKAFLAEEITLYQEQKIISAGAIIVENAVSNVRDGDVILVYAHSSLVARALIEAKKREIDFRVVVVDSHPKFEGRTLMRRLVEVGIHCTYSLITSLSYVLEGVTKVFIGAHALFSNGAVIARVGTAVVALMANAHSVPVLVLSESYKFHERVQLDAITFNELEDPSDLVTNTPNAKLLESWETNSSLKMLNLAFDITPLEHVSVVVTEVGMIPPTSVPVVLREASQKLEKL